MNNKPLGLSCTSLIKEYRVSHCQRIDESTIPRYQATAHWRPRLFLASVHNVHWHCVEKRLILAELYIFKNSCTLAG